MMQTLKLQTFSNTQTGNVAELIIDDLGKCVYYQEICKQGRVTAGLNQEGYCWADWCPEQGPSVTTIADVLYLDEALRELERLIGNQHESRPWSADATGF